MTTIMNIDEPTPRGTTIGSKCAVQGKPGDAR